MVTYSRWLLLSLTMFVVSPLLAQELDPTVVDEPTKEAAEPVAEQNPPEQAVKAEEKKETWPFGDPKDGVRLSPKDRVWVIGKKKMVILDGVVCMREGQLEMFACPPQTKEHESLISVRAVPELVHAGLLAVGAKAGHPVKFDPYAAATGTEIEIRLLWVDKDGKRKNCLAQEWVRNARTRKKMEHHWVFGGSGFWTDEDTGKRHYYANAGDFICVSNFGTAMLDLPINSSQANGALLFEAFTENMPPLKTKVRMVLTPKAAKKKP